MEGGRGGRDEGKGRKEGALDGMDYMYGWDRLLLTD